MAAPIRRRDRARRLRDHASRVPAADALPTGHEDLGWVPAARVEGLVTGRGRKGVAKGGRRHLPEGEPGPAELDWLRRGVDQPGGKLPLFDAEGQRIDPAVVRACVKAGWAAPWFENPLKPDWQVCRLTDAGRALIAGRPRPEVEVSMVIPVSS
jgi:hypothetical protein